MESGNAPLVTEERNANASDAAAPVAPLPSREALQAPSSAPSGGDGASEICRHRCIRSLFVLQVLVSAANSWALGPLFDVDIFLQTGSNVFVGLVESVKGITGFAGAVPLGYLADRYPREKLLAISALIGVPIALLTSYGLLTATAPAILMGTGLFALYMQAMTGAMNALLADLAAPGRERARIMADQTVVSQIGMAGGPFVQLVILLVTRSKSWDVGELNVTLVIGMLPLLLAVPPALYLRQAIPNALAKKRQLEVTQELPTNSSADIVPAWAMKRYLGGRVEARWVVIALVEGTFIITLLITGTSVKYFPLFFKQDFSFTPVGLCAMNCTFPAIVALAVPFCVRIAQRLGSVAGIVSWTLLGGGFQIAFAGSQSAWTAVLLFQARHAFMRSRDPLYQALLYDCLEPRLRGRFGSVIGLRGISWAGSAAIGGYILDHNGSNYRSLFVTSGFFICLLPTTLILPLACVVPRDRSST